MPDAEIAENCHLWIDTNDKRKTYLWILRLIESDITWFDFVVYFCPFKCITGRGAYTHSPRAKQQVTSH